MRSHGCGDLRPDATGQAVQLCGWVDRSRDHGGVIFIDLRDSSGSAQVVFRDADVLARAHRLRAEFCVAVEGVVEIRPAGNANPDIATGDIEVNATLNQDQNNDFWWPTDVTSALVWIVYKPYHAYNDATMTDDDDLGLGIGKEFQYPVVHHSSAKAVSAQEWNKQRDQYR